MEVNYEIEGKNLKISSCLVKFEYNIEEVICCKGIYIVLLNIPNEVNTNNNIYGVDSMGKIIWQIENPIEAFKLKESEQGYSYLASSVYVQINMTPEGLLIGTTFSGMKNTFDYQTGKLIKREWVRW